MEMTTAITTTRRIVAVLRVLVAIPSLCVGAIMALGTLWFGFQHGPLDALLRIVAVPTFAVLPFIPFGILPRQLVRVGVPILCAVVGVYTLLSLPGDFSAHERTRWGMAIIVPMATLIVAAILTDQPKRTEKHDERISPGGAPSAPPNESSP